MAITVKNPIPFEHLEKIAELMKAIAHPARIQIIELLVVNSELSVSEIYEEVDIEQSLASHHLTKMRDKGLLAKRRDGKNIYYSLNEPQVINMLECMRACKI